MSNKNISKILKEKLDDMYQQKCSKYPGLDKDNVLDAVPRIIVIGDLHGDFDRTIESLKIGKVLKINNNFPSNSKKRYEWIGGDTVVVQVGDQIDRCRKLPCHNPEATNPDENSDLKILKFFTDLHFKAIRDGGAVYSLVGNHELMNVSGRMDYVSYKNIVGFENEQEYGDKLYQGKIPQQKKDLEARKWVFSPGNPLSEFLACTRKFALKIGSNLFVHAGILPQIADKYNNIEDMNKILSSYLFNLLDKKELEKHQLLLGPEIMNSKDLQNKFNTNNYNISPLWNREFGNLSKLDDEDIQVCNRLLSPIQKVYSVNNMFIGHTPQLKNGINSTCNNQLWFTDIGLSKAFDGFK